MVMVVMAMVAAAAVVVVAWVSAEDKEKETEVGGREQDEDDGQIVPSVCPWISAFSQQQAQPRVPETDAWLQYFFFWFPS